MTIETTVFTFKLSNTLEEWVKMFDSPEIDAFHKTVGLTDKEIDEKFGFLIEALEMGAPPHGGIAFGLDRITMLIIGADSIRETIAYPKNQQAKCLLTNAPSNVSESQLKELDIEITIDE